MLKQITPAPLRKSWITVPVCICSLTLGLLLVGFLALPGWYPAVHERILDRHMVVPVLVIGLLNITLPVSLLYYLTSKDDDD